MKERNMQMKEGTKKLYDVNIKKTRTYEESGGK